MGIVVVAGGIFNFTLPMVLKFSFKGDITDWGVLMALYQTGAFAAAVLLRRFSTSLDWRIMLALTFTLTAVAMASIGLPGFTRMSGQMVLAGGGFTTAHIVLESKIMHCSPFAQRGKIAAQIMMQKGILYCGSSLVGAYLSGRWVPDDLILFGALMLMAGVPLVFRSTASLKRSL